MVVVAWIEEKQRQTRDLPNSRKARRPEEGILRAAESLPKRASRRDTSSGVLSRGWNALDGNRPMGAQEERTRRPSPCRRSIGQTSGLSRRLARLDRENP